jgi:hypothetical protein
MARLIEPPRTGRTIGDFGYQSASLPRYGGGNRRLRGIPSYGYASPIASYKVGSGSKRPSALPATMTSSGGVSFTGTPGNSGNYTIGQESYDVGGGAKQPSTGAMIGDIVKLGAITSGVGTGLNALGLPTFGMPVIKDLDKASSGLGSLFKTGPKVSAAELSKFGTSSNPYPTFDSAGNLIPATDVNKIGSTTAPYPKSGEIVVDGKVVPAGETGFFDKVGNFFNTPREFLTGADGVGLFGNSNVAGSGISSVGNVLGTVGGLFSLNEFIKDPSLASGLGTLAGAGASGIGAFSGLATAAPWLAGAALVASLLGNKKPSNKTGYTSIDLDEFKPVSFGMEGKKYSKENVDQTMQIMEPIIPAIQQLEEQYGVDLKGDIQVNYGGRDGLAYNIGNRNVTGFRNRLDYFDGRDQSTRDGGSIFRKTFKGENAGKDFYTSLLGDLEALARQKQAEGGGIIDLANYSGVQRQVPNYGNIQPTGMAGLPGLANQAPQQQTTNPFVAYA